MRIRLMQLTCLVGWMLAVASCRQSTVKGNEAFRKQLLDTPGLVALWDFREEAGQPRKAAGMGEFPLKEAHGLIPREEEGPISGYSARFDSGTYLSIPWSEASALNIHGKEGVTVMAWVRWSGKVSSFIAGMWNEYQNGGRRQYGLFISLPHYNGARNVCGHISKDGHPTPPFPFSIDYSASADEVPTQEWACVAFTYDGTYIISYLNGVYKERQPELIYNTTGFKGYPDGLVQTKNPYYYPYGMGDNGSDFTVGAVTVKAGLGNFYKGLLGGVAVFDRALTKDEMAKLAIMPNQK